MRRFRNPRYAPEALERKLSPSGVSLAVTAEYATASPNPAASSTVVASNRVTDRTAATATVEPPPVPDPTDPTDPNPCPNPGDPPSGGPSTPKGPDEPTIIAY